MPLKIFGEHVQFKIWVLGHQELAFHIRIKVIMIFLI